MSTTRARCAGWVGVVIGLAALGCDGAAPVYPHQAPQVVTIVNPAFTDEQRATFYHLSEGSEIIPLTWLLAFRTEDGRPFVDRLPELGFIPDAPGPHNPYGLPIGLTTDVPRDMAASGTPFVGVSC